MPPVPPKIKALLDTHKGEHAYIAVYLLIHQLGYSAEQALREVPFVETTSSNGGKDFTLILCLGAMELEYKVVEGYVPYMGADITAARLLRVEQEGGNYELVPDIAGYLAIEDHQTKEEIQQLIQEDYHQLIPQLWAWLDDPLKALL